MIPLKMKNRTEIEENPEFCPHLNLMIALYSMYHPGFEQVRSWFGVTVGMKGRKRRFVLVLASLSVQRKDFIFSSGRSGDEGKKDSFKKKVFCQDNFLCLGGSLLKFSTFNTTQLVMLNPLIIALPLPVEALLIIWIKLWEPISEQLCQNVSLTWLCDSKLSENVQPSSGKTILFYCTGTWLC